MSSRTAIHAVGSGFRPKPRPGLIVVPVDRETVVYDPPADLLHRLDPPASMVWSRLDGSVTVQQLAAAVAAEVREPVGAVAGDVEKLIRSLWESGLLAGSPTRPPAPPRESPSGLASDPLSTPLAEVDMAGLREPSHATTGHRALEHRFEVATDDPAVRDYLDDVLSGMEPTTAGDLDRYELLRTGDGGHYVVGLNGKPVAATAWLDRALAVLLWHINAEVVRKASISYPLVHASAAAKDDAAVLLVAPAGSGKTTTVAGLVRAGFGYLTDEAVAIDPENLRALPYPKALSVDRGSWEVLADLRPPHGDRVTGQWQVPPTRIRPGAVAGPTPVRFVVAPSYVAGSTTLVEPVSPAEMLVLLADSTFGFQANTERNLRALARLVSVARCYRLTVGDLDDAVALVEELARSEELDVTEREPPLREGGH